MMTTVYDPSKFDPISGDVIMDGDIPCPKRPGTRWEPRSSSLDRCKHCLKDYTGHGSQNDHLLCPPSDTERERYNRACSMRHYDGRLALIIKDLSELTEDQRGDLFHRLRDTFCLNCGAHQAQSGCKCPNAERC